MKHYVMLNCEIEVNEEKTKQWYAQAENWDVNAVIASTFWKSQNKENSLAKS